MHQIPWQGPARHHDQRLRLMQAAARIDKTIRYVRGRLDQSMNVAFTGEQPCWLVAHMNFNLLLS